jgi:hypothetical protein
MTLRVSAITARRASSMRASWKRKSDSTACAARSRSLDRLSVVSVSCLARLMSSSSASAWSESGRTIDSAFSTITGFSPSRRAMISAFERPGRPMLNS